MTNQTKSISVFGAGIFVGVSLFVAFPHGFLGAHTSSQIQVIDPEYATDFSDDRVLMGASHAVFVGKVIAQTNNKQRGIGPETQYQVEIIDDIKGDLQGIITVDQLGGYEGDTLYVVKNDNINSSLNQGGGYLLQPGSTYILATRYNSQENWYTLNPYPTASKLISNNSIFTNAQLKVMAENDSRFQALQIAYQHEILLGADVQHNNALNSYESRAKVQPKQVILNLTPPDVLSSTTPFGAVQN